MKLSRYTIIAFFVVGSLCLGSVALADSSTDYVRVQNMACYSYYDLDGWYMGEVCAECNDEQNPNETDMGCRSRAWHLARRAACDAIRLGFEQLQAEGIEVDPEWWYHVCWQAI